VILQRKWEYLVKERLKAVKYGNNKNRITGA
jgi:hypothetical protein